MNRDRRGLPPEIYDGVPGMPPHERLAQLRRAARVYGLDPETIDTS